MVGAGYLADQGRKAGPLLTVICAAVFLASGLAGVFEALLLSQEADTLAKAPVCGASAVSADCRLHLQGTVVGGYDEGSGLTPERHIDVKASSLDVLHLDSPIVGARGRRTERARFCCRAPTPPTSSSPTIGLA